MSKRGTCTLVGLELHFTSLAIPFHSIQIQYTASSPPRSRDLIGIEAALGSFGARSTTTRAHQQPRLVQPIIITTSIAVAINRPPFPCTRISTTCDHNATEEVGKSCRASSPRGRKMSCALSPCCQRCQHTEAFFTLVSLDDLPLLTAIAPTATNPCCLTYTLRDYTRHTRRSSERRTMEILRSTIRRPNGSACWRRNGPVSSDYKRRCIPRVLAQNEAQCRSWTSKRATLPYLPNLPRQPAQPPLHPLPRHSSLAHRPDILSHPIERPSPAWHFTPHGMCWRVRAKMPLSKSGTGRAVTLSGQ